MLAEKFFLILETIISNRSSDGAPRVVTVSPFVPIDDDFFLNAADGRTKFNRTRPTPEAVIFLRPGGPALPGSPDWSAGRGKQ
jgi:hypothetical protein